MNTGVINLNGEKAGRFDRNGNLITAFIGKYSVANRKRKKDLKPIDAIDVEKLNGDENATNASDESPTKK